MSIDVDSLSSINQLQAKQLAGRTWHVAGERYRFAAYDPRYPGDPPWKSGGEAIAYPLLDDRGNVALYAKFFDPARVTVKRVERTLWMIDECLGNWSKQLCAAPRVWVTTQSAGRPDQADFDFACCLADAVPGKTWHEIKADISAGVVRWTPELRERSVQDFIEGLSRLEQHQVLHGDLSPGNVIINPAAGAGEPMLYFIDFDAFVCSRAGRLQTLSTGEGGTIGTAGYCPPDLIAAASTRAVVPETDRPARDVLLLELIGFDPSCDFEEPASKWEASRRLSLLRSSPLVIRLPHLLNERLPELSHDERPATRELARALGIPVAPRVKWTTKLGPGHGAPPPGTPDGNRPSWKVLRRQLPWELPRWNMEKFQPIAIAVLAVLCLLHWSVVSGLLSLWMIPVVAESVLTVVYVARAGMAGALWCAGLVTLVRVVLADSREYAIPIGRYRLSLPLSNAAAKAGRPPGWILRHLIVLLAGLVLFVLVLTRQQVQSP